MLNIYFRESNIPSNLDIVVLCCRAGDYIKAPNGIKRATLRMVIEEGGKPYERVTKYCIIPSYQH